MRFFYKAIRNESYKICHSYSFWTISSFLLLIPFVATLFMFVLQRPDLFSQMELLQQKAQFASEATWQAYMDIQTEMIAVGGFIAASFLISWLFGHEFVHGTVKDLLVLPYARSIIVLAKFFCSFLALLSLMTFLLFISFIAGNLLELTSFSLEDNIKHAVAFLITGCLTIILSFPVAFIASLNRGYLAPFGFIIFLLIFSQLAIIVGYGEFFPWSLPALYSGFSVNFAGFTLKHISLIISTSTIGIVSTCLWWEYADHDV